MINIDDQTKKFALLGFPIEGSLSPLIHNYLFKENEENAVYLSLPLKEKEKFSEIIFELDKLGFSGLNLTLPYKKDILPILDYIDETAREIGSVNTVKYDNGKIKGYNTDSYGFIKALKDIFFSFKGINILVFGAGGASNAIIYALLKEEVGKIYLLNRTRENAEKIKKHFSDERIIVIDDLEEIKKKLDIKLLVNTTSVGNFPDENSSIISKEDLSKFKNAFVYDIVYKPEITKILTFARELNLENMNGLKMLVYQAIKAEEIWLERKIDEKNILNILYENKKS